MVLHIKKWSTITAEVSEINSKENKHSWKHGFNKNKCKKGLQKHRKTLPIFHVRLIKHFKWEIISEEESNTFLLTINSSYNSWVDHHIFVSWLHWYTKYNEATSVSWHHHLIR